MPEPLHGTYLPYICSEGRLFGKSSETHRKVTETFLDEAIGAGRSVICFVPKVKSSYCDIDLRSQIDM